jgi:integrase
MRQTEICQLHIGDVKEIDGVLCFDINANAEDKDVKSKAAVRTVPVHPSLIALGLLNYHKSLIEKKQKRLWPELEYKRDGYGQTLQRWYGRFNRKLFPDDRLKCFHSMRHCFITNLKLKGVEETAIMELVGHTNPSMTTGRYGKRFPPSKLLEAMNKLDYGFDVVKVVREAEKKH